MFVDIVRGDDLYGLWSLYPKDKPSNALLLDEVQTSLCHTWSNSLSLLGTILNDRQ